MSLIEVRVIDAIGVNWIVPRVIKVVIHSLSLSKLLARIFSIFPHPFSIFPDRSLPSVHIPFRSIELARRKFVAAIVTATQQQQLLECAVWVLSHAYPNFIQIFLLPIHSINLSEKYRCSSSFSWMHTEFIAR